MKKYYCILLFAITGLFLPACKTDCNAPAQNETINTDDSWSLLQQRLQALDMSYQLATFLSPRPRRSPSLPETIGQITNYEDWDFTDIGDSWSVAAADALGACSGIEAGAALSAGNPIVAAVTGAVVGAICSIAEYKKEEDNENNDELLAAFNPNNPFVYTTQGNRFENFGTITPIGSEIGDLHNSLIQELLNDESFVSCTSLEDMYCYMYSNSFNTFNNYCTSAQWNTIQTCLCYHQTDILSQQNLNSLVSSDEFCIIKHYAYTVSQTTEPFNIEQYTYDFMVLVDEAYQNDQISEESALLINGTISTMFCSKSSWNYIQPDPYQTTQYVVNTDSTWYILNGQNNLHALVSIGTNINFVGFPYVNNGTIKRIYIYTNSPYNTSYANDSILYTLLHNDIFLNTTNVVTNFSDLYIPLQVGYYPTYLAHGYDNYVYIDIE